MAMFDKDDDGVVVVIGSGAGGGTLANELCQKGVKVVLLEAGMCGAYLPLRRNWPCRRPSQCIRGITHRKFPPLRRDCRYRVQFSLRMLPSSCRRARYPLRPMTR